MKAKMIAWVTFFKQVNPKIIIITILSVVIVLLMTLSFLRKSSDDRFFDAIALANDYDNVRLTAVYNAPLYTAMIAQYREQGLESAGEDHEINTADMTGFRIDRDDADLGHHVAAYLDAQDAPIMDVLLVNRDHSVSFVHPGTTNGLYYLELDYFELDQSIDNTQISITINGESPFYESQTIVLPSRWMLSSDTFTLDRYQNEIQPNSIKVQDWFSHAIHDYRGMHPGLFAFHLNEGDTITISHVNGRLLLGNIRYVEPRALPTYAEYLAEKGSHPLSGDKIIVAARDMLHRNDPSIRLRPEMDPSNLYYDTQFLRLNVIFGDSWQNAGQAVTYAVEVTEAGYYQLSFKYRQYIMRDMTVFRKIKVNGDVPYDLLEHVAFPYTTSFMHRTLEDADGKPLYVYLEAGTHEITLEAVSYPYRQAIETIQYVMRQIQNMALDVKRYTSGGTDLYRDWDIEAYFPDAADQIMSWADLLEDQHQSLLVLSTVNNPSEISQLKVAATRLRNIASDINRLPSRMVQFSDGDSSVNQILGNLMQNLLRPNLELERLIVHGDVSIGRAHANLFVTFWEGLKRLVLSFVNNPYSASMQRRDNELMVWVNYPRQYIEIMQTMIDQYYDGTMNVTLSQMPDQNKLILANASGRAPDLAIGVNHWIPYEFAIRDASLDLRQFAGYADLVSNFTPGAIIPYVFEEGVYGLPSTQNFWVTYYRRDILDSIGIHDIPQTWDEIIEILPILQSYGMNYFVPLAQFSGLKPFVATLPFIYQFGGDLYTEDGMQTAINSEQTLKGISLMSELYTLYNLPKFVGSFYNHFRYGMLPIGISDLSTYILLQTAAVELDGLWGMDLHPGVYHEDLDTIVRYAAVGAQGDMILSTTRFPDEAWHFLSWWMSTPVQSEFAFLLQSTYGKAYFWNTANLEAFKTISMPDEYKQIVLAQWEHAIEASRIPGNYMVEREISNAWTRIVFEGANPRQALDEAVRISNREIIYKMAEFGYAFQGQSLKPYPVPSIYNIHEWLTEVSDD